MITPLYKPFIFLRLDKSFLLSEKKLLNILFDEVAQRVLKSEDTSLNDKSFKVALSKSYLAFLFKKAKTNDRASVLDLVDSLNEKTVSINHNDEEHDLINKKHLFLKGDEVHFSLNRYFNKFLSKRNLIIVDARVSCNIKKKNSLVFYELCMWKLRHTSQGVIRKTPYLPNEKPYEFNVSVSDIREFLGSDTNHTLSTSQYYRAAIEPSIVELNENKPGFSLKLISFKEKGTITAYTFVIENIDHEYLNEIISL